MLHPPKRSIKRAATRVRGLVKRMHEQARAVVSLFHSFLPPPPPVNRQQFSRASDEMLLAFLLFFSLSSLQSSACGTRYYTGCCVGEYCIEDKPLSHERISNALKISIKHIDPRCSCRRNGSGSRQFLPSPYSDCKPCNKVTIGKLRLIYIYGSISRGRRKWLKMCHLLKQNVLR